MSLADFLLSVLGFFAALRIINTPLFSSNQQNAFNSILMVVFLTALLVLTVLPVGYIAVRLLGSPALENFGDCYRGCVVVAACTAGLLMYGWWVFIIVRFWIHKALRRRR